MERFSNPGRSSIARLFRKPAKPLRAEIIYLPYYCFDIEFSGSADVLRARVAVDGLDCEGMLLVPDEIEFAHGLYQSCCDFERCIDEARQTALGEYRGMLLEYGLRAREETVVRGVSDAEPFLFPYWIGYFRRISGYDFRALDGVSGEPTGIRMRKVFLKALRQLEGK